jgi:chromosome segregation ATPase
MTRKRLTDMLRDEAQKPTAAESQAAEANAIAASSEQTETNKEPNKELEKLVTDLKASLAKALKKETTLSEQVVKLQAELHEKKEYVEKMKEYLDQATQIKAELDRVKQENDTLTDELSRLKTQKVETPAPDQPKKTLIQRAVPTSAGRSSRPVGANTDYSKINNDNIGWFD